jgi:hypothetical protein
MPQVPRRLTVLLLIRGVGWFSQPDLQNATHGIYISTLAARLKERTLIEVVPSHGTMYAELH